MNKPADFVQRERFIQSLDQSISVIAPAGVGKTESIVRRIGAMADADTTTAVDRLRRLVVVTYTRRAAREMKRRALAVLGGATHSEVRFAMQTAFFGTIHSFAVAVLRRHGHALGLSPELQQANDRQLAELWRQYRRRSEEPGRILNEARAAGLLRLVSVRDLLDQAFIAPVSDESPPMPTGPMPPVSIEAIEQVPPKGSAKRNTLLNQEAARDWVHRFERGDTFIPLPVMKGSAKALAAAWEAAFDPVRAWQQRATQHFVGRLAIGFAAFRAAEAVLTFDDQIRLARQLVEDPEAGADLRAAQHLVILDEAQDTDDDQFAFLMRVAGVGEAGNDGRFCMVGDFQQAIFGSRADPAAYRRAAVQLEQAGGGDARFDVTFRCDRSIVKLVNQVFAQVFNGVSDQASHVPLRSSDTAGDGQVTRWKLEAREPEAGSSKNSAWVLETESALLAAWIRQCGLKQLGTAQWGDVAILCARRRWCAAIEEALRREGVPVQRVGSRARRGELASFRWTAGLLKVIAEPANEFEVAGVLREVWGIKDETIYNHRVRSGRSLAIDSPTAQYFPALVELRRIWEKIRAMPLAELVRELLERAQMRHRLGLLPQEVTGDLEQDLDVIMAMAREAELQGETLEAFAKDFEESLEEEVPAEEPRKDAVQVCTLYKAKGLQWPVVILPFLGVNNEPNRQQEPTILDEDSGLTFTARRRLDREQKIEDRQRELARLLYVGVTRPKHALYLVDDTAVTDGSTLGSGAFRAVDYFLSDPICRETWEALPEVSIRPDETQRLLFSMEEETEAVVPQSPRADWTGYIDRITPFRLAVYPVIESPVERRLNGFPEEEVVQGTAADQASYAYGDWWHRGCEQTNWNASRETWQAVWDTWLRECPQRERGNEAWQRFLNSPAAEMLAARQAWVFRQELPLLVPFEQGGRKRCLDGFADFVGIAPDRSAGFILDWKTNRRTDLLVDEYRGQVQAYMAALSQLFGIPFTGWLYATESGELMEIREEAAGEPLPARAD